MSPIPLIQHRCQPLPAGVGPLGREQAEALLGELHPDWRLTPAGDALERTFTFHNFRATMLFANAIAWIAERENHHPELRLGYNTCVVQYRTHDVGGLSDNDFICAAKIDALLPL